MVCTYVAYIAGTHALPRMWWKWLGAERDLVAANLASRDVNFGGARCDLEPGTPGTRPGTLCGGGGGGDDGCGH